MCFSITVSLTLYQMWTHCRLIVPFPFCLNTVGVSLPVPEVCSEDYMSGVDHIYARPAAALPTTHAAGVSDGKHWQHHSNQSTGSDQPTTGCHHSETRKWNFQAEGGAADAFFFCWFTASIRWSSAVLYWFHQQRYINRCSSTFHPKRTRCIIGVAKLKTATTNYGEQRSSSKKADFLGVLVRLKVGLFTQDTAARMQISTSQFTRTFTSWIRPLRLELETTCRFPVTKVATEVLGLTGSRGDLMKGWTVGRLGDVCKNCLPFNIYFLHVYTSPVFVNVGGRGGGGGCSQAGTGSILFMSTVISRIQTR